MVRATTSRKSLFTVMHNSDPMGYSMEQLVRALAAETMSEISYDEAVVEEESVGGGMWENIASALLEEIDSTYSGDELQPYGYYADECLVGLRPLVQPYSVYPAAAKLLTALETLVQQKTDPRAYTTLVVRAMGSDAADQWQKEGRQFR